MQDGEKPGTQVLDELKALRRRVGELEGEEGRCGGAQEGVQAGPGSPGGESAESGRLLAAVRRIGHAILSSLDLDEVLDAVAREIVEAGILRSAMVALVDHEAGCVEVVRSLRLDQQYWPLLDTVELKPGVLSGKLVEDERVLGYRYSLDDDNVTAQVARTGRMEVIETWDDPRLDRRFDSRPEGWSGKVAYFVPVKHGDRVLAVLGTGSRIEEKEHTLRRIERMQPFLDQVAIALEHARLYRESREHARELLRLNRTLEAEIAERKKAERELVRLERLRALGEMSAGVSHNLNNVLTGVLGPAQLLQRMTDDARVLEEVGNIIAAAIRARDLVHRLHLSTRGVEEDALRPVEVNRVIREAVQAARPRWRDEPEARAIPVEVASDLGDVPPITGTDSELHDILVNLLLNAVDAMPEGGAMGIRTRAVDGGVQIVVSDTGVGMDEETRRRVFEPFFTTKMDVGSGLGLSTAYGAVARWGGEIDVESAPGEGATFTIWLPARTGPDAEAGSGACDVWWVVNGSAG